MGIFVPVRPSPVYGVNVVLPERLYCNLYKTSRDGVISRNFGIGRIILPVSFHKRTGSGKQLLAGIDVRCYRFAPSVREVDTFPVKIGFEVAMTHDENISVIVLRLV